MFFDISCQGNRIHSDLEFCEIDEIESRPKMDHISFKNYIICTGPNSELNLDSGNLYCYTLQEER